MATTYDTSASLADHDPVAYLDRLFERLKQVPHVTFQTDPPPFHSSYGEYYVFGVMREPEHNDQSSNSISHASTSSVSSHPLSAASSHSLSAASTNPFSAIEFRRSSSISDLNSSASSAQTPPSSEPSHAAVTNVIACISPRLLWIQRTYQMARTVHSSSSASARQHKHGFQFKAMYRLSPQLPEDRPLQVIINEQFGYNHLKALMNFGPNWYALSPGKPPLPYNPDVTSDGESKPGTISMTEFFDFAINASEALEMLHNDNRVVHGELRGDAFHFHRPTKNVRLAGFGSGARAFENGLTSAGWKSLSREYGVEYKLQFVAPEQTGRLPAAPDSRTDIYSLGVVFWVLLTGEMPFHGETALEVMQNVLSKRMPHLSSKRVDAPDALCGIITKMTQKNIEDRYFSITGLKKDLLQIQKLLSEGDSTGLANFVAGTSDKSTFFTLPNIQVGRDEVRATIMEVVNDVVALQQRIMPAPRPQMLTTVDSNSSVSSRSINAPLEETISDDASVNSKTNSGSGTNATAIRMPDRFNAHTSFSQDVNGDGFDGDSIEVKSTSTDRRMSTGTPASMPSSDHTRSLSLMSSLQENPNTVLRSTQRYQRKGKCEVITISGVAGLGKSTLVTSIQNAIRTEKLGYFASAKFDQARQTPFEPVLKVMSSLLRQIFSESDISTEFHRNLRSFVRPVWGALSSMLKLPHWLLDSTQTSITVRGVDTPSRSSAASTARRPSTPSNGGKQKKNQKRCGAIGNDTAAFLRTGAQSKSSRFSAIFLDLLRFLSTHKFILFCLDDVQFADNESFELLQTIIATKINMVIMLTYREINQLSPKVRTLFTSNSISLTKIQLKPLTEDNVAEYICATLHRSREAVTPLVAVAMEKTLGNPFFLREMLQTCYDKGAIEFCLNEQKWVYDVDKVLAQFSQQDGAAINSNEYIVSKFSSLPSATRHFLAWASLLGNSFSYTLVKDLIKNHSSKGPTTCFEKKPSTKKKDLTRKSSDEVVRGLQGALEVYIIMATEDDDIFQFCHDRYQQAALSLFDCGGIAEMHFAIAQQMMQEYTRHDEDSVQIYDLSSHISPAVHLIKKNISNRSVYRDILYRSGDKAAESGGRNASLDYYTNAMKLLQDDPWDETKPDVFYSETLTLHCKTAETQFFLGSIEVASELLETIFKNAKSNLDRAPAWVLKSRISARQGSNKEAFAELSQCLSELGVEIPDRSWEECDKEFERIRDEFKSVDTAQLLQKPLSTCQWLMTVGCVLCEAIFASVWIHPLQFYHLALKQFNLYMKHGITTQTGMACVHLGTVTIGHCGDVEFGTQLGELGRNFLEIHESDMYTQGRAWTLYTLLLGYFVHDMRSLLPLLERAQQAALNSGDRYGALFSVGWQASAKIFCSHTMPDVENFCLYAAEELSHWQDDVRSSLYLIAARQYARAMQGKTWTNNPALIMSDGEHDTESYLQYVDKSITNSTKAMIIYEVWRLQLLYLFNHYDAAIKLGEESTKHWEGFNSMRYLVVLRAYLCLSYLAALREDPSKYDSETVIPRVRHLHSLLVQWASVNEVNFLVYTSLIEAELAEIEEKYDTCLQKYETGLDHAEIHGLTIEQALISELYGEFMIRRRANRPAKNSLKDAITAWRSVSAYGKATHLSSKHEWLLRGTASLTTSEVGCQTDTTKDSSPIGLKDIGGYARDSAVSSDRNAEPKSHAPPESMLDIIDLKGILKSSEALNSTIDLDQLMEKMTNIILEASGGDFCAIVCEDETKPDQWVVAGISGSTFEEAGEELNSANGIVGVKVTLYCLRFRETIFIDNIYDDERFNVVSEEYRQRNPGGRAIIVVPILTGNHEILGSVYVEGPPHSFTEKDRTILQLLTNSIAISMANAKLFKRVEKVSASNAVMVESQKKALSQARISEKKAIAAEKEAMRSVREKEEAAKAKSMFLANVSHELRTPLNGVIGMSELLKSSSLSSEQEGYADSIRVCADTLLTVINDILDFSKLEAGKMQMFSVPLSLSETISEVVRALSYSNRGKELETVTDLKVDRNLLVLGDPVRLHQILMNLLSNAYKFTSKGSVRVGLEVEADRDKDIKVTCSVEDSGIGISEEVKQKLFLPFSQADSSTARSFGGTGLGLSICKAIIENVMGGKIWLESELGKGTKVSFSLTFAKAPKDSKASVLHSPRHQEHDPMAIFSPKTEVDRSASLRQVQDLSAVPRSELRVCIAEDNPINQKIAISFVSRLGFKPEAFNDGQQALDALTKASKESKPFHVVLMDVQMPVLDGYNATRAIRKHEDPLVREVLVIAMTASAIPGDREKCLDAGMNNYLAKPVRQQVLKKMLNDYLENKPAKAKDLQNPQGGARNGASNGKTNGK